MKIKTNKTIVVLDILFSYSLRVIGLAILCLLINSIGNLIFGDLFKSEYLFSIAFIPFVELIKTFPRNITYPLTLNATLIDKTITVKTGLVEMMIDTLDIDNIENIEYRYSIIGKMFGYKTITIQNYGGFIQIPYVHNAESIVKIIKERKNHIPNAETIEAIEDQQTEKVELKLFYESKTKH